MNLETNPGLIFALILLVVIVIAAVVIILCTKKGKKKIVVDEELISNMISYLGGKENIKSYSKENARVKFEVNELDKVNLESLKTISIKGVFVTGNNVKTLFKYDSELIVKMLDKILK